MAQHGLRSTYQHAGCRCDPCREAERVYHKQNRTIQHKDYDPILAAISLQQQWGVNR